MRTLSVGHTTVVGSVTRLTEGQGTEADLQLLEEFAASVKTTSLCGLGQTAPNPILTTLRYFRHEFEAHVREKKCPAKVCKALLTYTIAMENCRGCGICANACPTDAISGEKGKPFQIDQEACVHCGSCHNVYGSRRS